jgi:hypothetical protein
VGHVKKWDIVIWPRKMLRNIKTLGTSKSIKSSKLPSTPRRRKPRKEKLLSQQYLSHFLPKT